MDYHRSFPDFHKDLIDYVHRFIGSLFGADDLHQGGHDDIEHRILRPLWREPRTHYAINCASIGCPNLMREAFTAGNTEALLDAGARAYVNHPRGVTVAGDNLVVSSIYDWFQVDFGGSDKGVIRHLRQYAEPALEARLQRFDSIDDDEYDWSLNDVPR